jgi:hypothetical protein
MSSAAMRRWPLPWHVGDDTTEGSKRGSRYSVYAANGACVLIIYANGDGEAMAQAAQFIAETANEVLQR